MSGVGIKIAPLDVVCPVCATERTVHVSVEEEDGEFVIDAARVRVTRLDCEECGEERPHKPVAMIGREVRP